MASPRPASGMGIDGDRRRAASIERLHHREEIGRRFAQIGRRRQVEDGDGFVRHPSIAARPEGEQRLAGPDLARIEPHRGARRIVRGQHAGRLDARRAAAQQRLAEHASRCPRPRRRPGAAAAATLPSTLTIVDSRPTGVGPPSTISGMREPRSASTAAAVVALTRPEELALGAASGRPSAAISSAPKPFGMRSAIVSRPAVTSGWIAAPVSKRQHQRQRPRPERLGELLRQRIEQRDRSCHLKRRDMGDQRIEARPALGLEDARDGAAVGGVAGQAVDGLGRDRHDLARLDQRRGPRLARPCLQ